LHDTGQATIPINEYQQFKTNKLLQNKGIEQQFLCQVQFLWVSITAVYLWGIEKFIQVLWM